MFNVNYHLEGELGTLCNISANWAKSAADIFLSNQYLFTYFFS